MAHGFTIDGEVVGTIFSVIFLRLFFRVFWRESKEIIRKSLISIVLSLMAFSLNDTPWTNRLKLFLLLLAIIVLISGWMEFNAKMR